MQDYPKTFKSQEGYQAIVADYDRLLNERWSVKPQCLDIPSEHGSTHVLVAGDENAPPIILLHGAMIHAGTWYTIAPELSKHFRVILPDLPGQSGKTFYKQARHKGAYEVDWLKNVMDALSISSAHILGLSLGGWLALMMGIYAPERVERIVSIAPASFVRLNYQFLFRSIWAALNPTQKRISSVVKYMSAPSSPINEDIVTGMQLVFKHVSPMQPPPRRFSDSELQGIEAPTLIMVGEYEVIYQHNKLIKRASEQIKGVQTCVIPNASHGILYEQSDLVLEKVKDFLRA